MMNYFLDLPSDLKCETLKLINDYGEVIEDLSLITNQSEKDKLLGCVIELDSSILKTINVDQVKIFPKLEKLGIPFVFNMDNKIEVLDNIFKLPSLKMFKIIFSFQMNVWAGLLIYLPKILDDFLKSKGLNGVNILLRMISPNPNDVIQKDYVCIEESKYVDYFFKIETIPLIKLLQTYGGAKIYYVGSTLTYIPNMYGNIKFDKIIYYSEIKTEENLAETHIFSQLPLLLNDLDKNTSNLEFRINLSKNIDKELYLKILFDSYIILPSIVRSKIRETNCIFSIRNELDSFELTRNCPNIKLYYIRLLDNPDKMIPMLDKNLKLRGKYKLIAFNNLYKHPLVEQFKFYDLIFTED